MNILYIGDIMAQPGIEVVEKVLPSLRKDHNVDLVVAQAENVTNGKGMNLADMERLQKTGVDFFTGGNWTPTLDELYPSLENPNKPVIGPANLPSCPGKGYKILDTKKGNILVISLLGSTIGSRVPETENPLHAVDAILRETIDNDISITVVNIHGDYSSEKRVIGYYLDGRVSLVVGDHWHVPTADHMILPKGTAHVTDVGMCGSLHSSLGVELDVIISRWRDGMMNRNALALDKPWQFNAILANIDEQSGLAHSIERIQRIVE